MRSRIRSAQRAWMRGPPIRGNCLAMTWARAVFSDFCWRGPYFLRMKSGVLPMVVPPVWGFFFRDRVAAEGEKLAQVIGHVLVGSTPFEQFEVLADEGGAAPEQVGDLRVLEFFFVQLGAADEGGKVVGNGFGGMFHDLADL